MSQHNAFYKLDDTDNIIFIVEDHQTTLAKMKISRFVSHFSNQIDSLENSLCLILDVIDQANVFQTKFFLLEVCVFNYIFVLSVTISFSL